MSWLTASVLTPGTSAGNPIWFDERLGFLVLMLAVVVSAGVIFAAGLFAQRQTYRVVWTSPDGGGRAAAPRPHQLASASA